MNPPDSLSASTWSGDSAPTSPAVDALTPLSLNPLVKTRPPLTSHPRRARSATSGHRATTLIQSHPALVAGGLLVAGVLVGRLAKATVQSLHDDAPDDTGEFQEHYPDGTDFPAQHDGQTDYAADHVQYNDL
jgi:hypothetical protein